MSARSSTFQAQAFHPDFGNEVIGGELFFTGGAAHFRSGETGWTIPCDRLAVEIEEGGERLFLTDPEQAGLKIITSAPDLLACRTLPEVERIRQALSAQLSRREVTRRLKIVLGFVGVSVLLVWGGMISVGWMVRAIVARVPPEWEAQLGAKLLAELQGELAFVTDTNYVNALTALAEPLLLALPGSPTNYTFHVVQDEEPNALALPGGHILVNTGLMEMTDQPEELLGVIAHEVAHITRQHHLRSEIASGGPFLIFRVFIGGRSGALGMAAGVSAFMIGQGFSQEYETEADNAGWDYLIKANIDPRGMIAVFRKLSAHENHRKALKLPQAFSSHPALEKRIRRLETKWKKLPRQSGFVDLGRPGLDESRNQKKLNPAVSSRQGAKQQRGCIGSGFSVGRPPWIGRAFPSLRLCARSRLQLWVPS